MSIWATTWAYEQPIKPVGKKFVLVSLANFADETGYCFPSQQTLASMTDQGVSTVREHLKSLESDRFILREHRYATDDKGGRTSDGFYLQAPANRLKPPSKQLPPKPGVKSKRVTAKKDRAYRQVSGDLPPNSGGDPSVDPLEKEKTLSAHAEMMDFHAGFLEGPIPDGGAQGKAVKWLLEHYSTQECRDFYEHLRGEAWRTSPVTWLTVKRGIADWLARGRTAPAQSNGNGHKKEYDPLTGEEWVRKPFTADDAVRCSPDKNPDDVRANFADPIAFPWENVRCL